MTSTQCRWCKSELVLSPGLGYVYCEHCDRGHTKVGCQVCKQLERTK